MDEATLTMIDEVEAVKGKLSDWEYGFIFGGDGHDPLRKFRALSSRQLFALRQIHTERVQGKESKSSCLVGNRVKAQPGEGGHRIILDGKPVGPAVTKREAETLVQWLDLAANDITGSVKKKDAHTPPPKPKRPWDKSK